MGLFDFLKKKPATPEPSPAAAPANAPAGDAASAPKPAPTGPRYKGSNYTLPVEETPAAPFVPPMPAMPQAAPEAPVQFPYQPSNVLEELLMRAAHEPALRPAFYQALVNEELFAVTPPNPDNPSSGELQLTPGMEIQLQVLHDGKIPLFSSVERIHEGGVAPADVTYIRVRGFDLLQMVQAADCVLNPFSPAGKLLASQEIQDLLAGNLFPPADGPGGQVPVQLAPPADEPTELLEALRAFATNKPFIAQAYLAEMRLENSDEPPRLLLAFRVPDNQDPAFLQELGPIIEGRLQGYQFVDMMLLMPSGAQEPLNQYFDQQTPYYQK